MSSLLYIRDNHFNQNDLNLTFTVCDKDRGNVELVKGGSSLFVNNYNKSAYIKLLLDYYGYHRSQRQIEEFLKGFYQVIPKKIAAVLELSDFEKILFGVSKINISDWKENTKYIGEGASEDTPVVKLFWDQLGLLNDLQLRKLLQY